MLPGTPALLGLRVDRSVCLTGAPGSTGGILLDSHHMGAKAADQG
jgi:hypothetical protein